MALASTLATNLTTGSGVVVFAGEATSVVVWDVTSGVGRANFSVSFFITEE
jgi:hypothetical protein